MKGDHSADFRVTVYSTARGLPPDQAPFHEGMFEVQLNEMVRIWFIPPFAWDPWPPAMPLDIDIVSSVEEARRVNAALHRYVVTPLAERAGEERACHGFPLEDGEETESTLYYVTPDEYAALVSELRALAEHWDRSKPVRVSMLKGSHLAKLLLTRMVISPHFEPRHRWVVGRGPLPDALTH